MVAAPASLHLVAGGVDNSPTVQHERNTLLSMPLQRPLKDLPYHSCRFRLNNEMILVSRVLLISVYGKSTDVLPLLPLHVKDHADIFGQVFQIPLIDQAVDLPGFFVPFHLCVGVVGHSDESDPPDGKHAVDVLLHQFHIPGEPGLAFAEDDLELLFLGRFDHPVEVRPQAVSSRIVLIAVDVIDVPAPLHCIVDQQRFLVLDTLRFRFIFVFILLTQPCIDCTKDMLHLLKGVTAPLDRSTRAAARQEII